MVYGKISPKIIITDVEMKNPERFPSMSAIKIEKREFARVTPSKIVTRS